MMVGKLLLSLLVGFALTNALPTDDALTCYNCGYLEMMNGTRIPLKEEYEDIPFCGDFASGDEFTVPAMMVSGKF